MKKKAEGGEYERITVAEFCEELKVDEFGGVFAVSRKMLMNDDTGSFTRVPASMGAAARSTVGDLVYDTLTANADLKDGKPIFHADRKNILTGAASVLSEASLSEAVKNMRTQKDPKTGARIQVRPKYLIVPAALEATARRLMVDDHVVGAGRSDYERPPGACRSNRRCSPG